VVASIDRELEFGRRCEVEPDLDDPSLDGARLGEPRIREDAQHAAVRPHHLGDESLDAGSARHFDELLEQSATDASSLVPIGDRERDFRGATAAETDVLSGGDDGGAMCSDQRAAFLPVRLEHRLDEPLVHVGAAVEPEVEALIGKAAEEGHEARHIVS
jgi:hypothetical protein